MGVRARYLEWANGFGPEWVRAVSWPQGWIAAALVLATLFVLMDSLEATRGFFELDLAPALTLLAIGFGALLVADRLEARGAFTALERAAASLVVAFLIQLFTSAVVVLSAPPGAFAVAVFPILAAWQQLGMLRAGPRYPFATLAHGAAMALAAAAAPDPVHLGILATVALIGLGGGTLLGLITSWGAAADARLDAHRAALGAQSLAVFAAELDDVNATLAEVGAVDRELRVRLAQARLACAGLEAASAGGGASGDDAVNRAVSRVRGALSRFDDLLAAPAPLRESKPDGAPVAVAVLPVVRAALADARRRWPQVAWSCAGADASSDAPFVELAGGPDGLRAMLDPLLANAAEGDGAFGASRVDVHVGRAGEAVEVAVCDDGPGFPAALLKAPIALLGTTKRRGSGLGLYTAERLARGSGGALSRERPLEGGARVCLRLPGAPRRGGRGGTA
ncbi:MAG TPA: ATP-binding protein [Myxococcota bacterium]|nr:ATP-binding protein [Myxococcota bacterium]